MDDVVAGRHISKDNVNHNEVRSNCVFAFYGWDDARQWVQRLAKNKKMHYDGEKWMHTYFDKVVFVSVDGMDSGVVLCMVRKGAQRGRFGDFLDYSQVLNIAYGLFCPDRRQSNEFEIFARVCRDSQSEMQLRLARTLSVGDFNDVNALRDAIAHLCDEATKGDSIQTSVNKQDSI